MWGLSRWNSGDDWYFRNSDAQSASDIGGRDPVTGFHSVILKPDSVNLVSPPKITIPKTLAALPNNQYATVLAEVSGKLEAFAVLVALAARSIDAAPACDNEAVELCFF